jgi:1,4-alpha-glucan branching enzyme
MMTRAAEMASRVRQLLHRSESIQNRLAIDDRVIGASNRPNDDGAANGWRAGANAVHGGVRFVFPGKPGHTVFVAGDFNGWAGGATPLEYDGARGLYAAFVPLPAGRRLYRLVIDGVWKADPHNPEIEENPFGDRNSVVVVRPPAPTVLATPA